MVAPGTIGCTSRLTGASATSAPTPATGLPGTMPLPGSRRPSASNATPRTLSAGTGPLPLPICEAMSPMITAPCEKPMSTKPVSGQSRCVAAISSWMRARPSACESSYDISCWALKLRNCAVYGTVHTFTSSGEYAACSGAEDFRISEFGFAVGLIGSSSARDSHVPGAAITSTAGHHSGCCAVGGVPGMPGSPTCDCRSHCPTPATMATTRTMTASRVSVLRMPVSNTPIRPLSQSPRSLPLHPWPCVPGPPTGRRPRR